MKALCIKISDFYSQIAGTISTGIYGFVTILAFAEFTIAVSYFGQPLIKGIFRLESGYIAISIFLMLVILALINLWARGKLSIPDMNWFQIILFVFIIWALMSLMWSATFSSGFARLATWLVMGILPMELAIILFPNLNFQRFLDSILFLGLVILIISFITIKTQSVGPMMRFSPTGGEKVAYARTMGFFLLCLAWIFDKTIFWRKIVVIALFLPTVYFLICAATRAPFAIALFLAFIYVFFASRIKKIAKSFILLIIGGAAIQFLSGSFMIMRILTVFKSVEFSSSVRGFIWNTVLKNLSNIPLWGIGIGSFKIFLPKMLKHIQHPHNSFLEMLIELGIPGLMMYLILMFPIPLLGLKKYLANRKTRNNQIYVLEFGLLIWSYGFLNSLINDALAGGIFEWISLGIIAGTLKGMQIQKEKTNTSQLEL